MKTLYKKDSKGKIREWTICTIDDELIQKSGIVDGKLVEHNKLCKSKNVGKSNSTTGSEQAILEMESLIKSKLSEGYFNTKDEAENEQVILPVLAKDYKKEFKKVDWNNCFIQRKFDGMRNLCHIKNGEVTFVSRDGKIIEGLDHIKNEIKSQIKSDTILDGELFSKELGSFQDNMSAIKSYKKGLTEKVKYHVYDLVHSDMSFVDRIDLVDAICSNMKNVELVETIPVTIEADMLKYHAKFVSEGFEGTMIRTGVNGYQVNKRSSDLLKYKDFQDIDAEIIDITPNDSNPLHGTPLLKYNSSTFKAGVKMSHEDRIDLLANKHLYIGKKAGIRFFEWTDDGNPRFPVMIGIHLDR
jgi:hypothetical protein